jgi:integrase/recombinase XerD
MVKLKTILDVRRAKSDGTYPILFRVTDHKDVKYITTGISIDKQQWDEKSNSINKRHPNATTINSLISKRYYEIQKALTKLEENECYTFNALKEALAPKEKKQEVKTPSTFLEFSTKVIDDFKAVKRTGNALVYLSAVNRLIAYSNNRKITFEQIDYTFLEAFRDKLLQDGLKVNSVGNYYRSIRAIYNKAIKAKIVSRDLYPFKDISIKTDKTAKRAIKIDDLAKIYQYPKKTKSQEWHSANYFFLSFALRGMSFTDMAYLKTDNLYKGFLTYKRRKTKKIYNIRLHPLALEIFKLYQNNNTDYLIPVFPKGTEEDGIQAKKITRQWIKQTNEYLKQLAKKCSIDTNLTTYVARHTWATTAKRLGYANEMIAEALGHEYGNKITNTYLDNFDEHLVNQMNIKVIAGIYKCQRELKHNYRYVLRYYSKLDTYVQYKRLFPYPLTLIKKRDL